MRENAKGRCICYEGEVPFQVVDEDGAGLSVDVRHCAEPDCPYRYLYEED